jgi:hypothetical protein
MGLDGLLQGQLYLPLLLHYKVLKIIKSDMVILLRPKFPTLGTYGINGDLVFMKWYKGSEILDM